jgi:DNA polymerase-3 subunit gamma/tau
LDLCACASKNIDEQTVESVCAMAGNDYLLEITEFIKQRDTENALLMIEKLQNSSVDMARLLSELISHFRDLMIVKTVKGDKKPIVCSSTHLKKLQEQAEGFDIKDIMYTLNILQGATAVMQSGNRRCEMEMAIIKLCNPALSVDLESLERRIAALEDGNVKPKPQKVKTQPVVEEITEPIEEEKPQEEPLSEDIKPVEKWDEIITILKTSCPLIAGVLDDSKAYIKGAYLLIDAKNDSFRTMINNANGLYKDSIRKAAQKVLGHTYKLGPYTKQTVSAAEDPLKALADKLKQFENN